MNNTNPYLCYLPMSMLELDGTELKFMISILYKMRVNKRIENVEFVVSDIKGISKRSFFMCMESLTTQHYLKVSKVDKQTYAISLNMESQKYTDQDIEHLTRPFRNEPILQNVPKPEEPKPLTMGDLMPKYTKPTNPIPEYKGETNTPEGTYAYLMSKKK